jgi:hypothetical protein
MIGSNLRDTLQARPAPLMSLPWVESPFFDRELAARAESLSPERRDQASKYHDQGFLALSQIVPHELCERVKKQLDPFFRQEEGGECIAQPRIQDAWSRGCDAVRQLALFEPILELLQDFYERRPIPFQTLGFKWGSEQRGHSDSIHFSCLPARYMCGVWVALEDVGPDNGPLFYYPGSHKLPEATAYDLGQTVDAPYYHLYEEFQEELMIELDIEPVEFHARQGDALIWSSNIVHGGRPVTGPHTTRWSQVSHMYFENCIYYTPFLSAVPFGEFLLKEIIDLSTMEPVAHNYNGQELDIRLQTNGRSRIYPVGDGDSSEFDEINEELALAQKQVDQLRSSASFRLGHALLEPARRLRRPAG